MKKYTYVFLDSDFSKVDTLAALKKSRCRYDTKLVLRLNGKPIGQGQLYPFKANVHTESVALDKRHRRKGHGIYLYLGLIQKARSLGARRIYSSVNLNRFSTRMWSVKLARYFKVHVQKLKHHCGRCGSNNPQLRYYIVL